MFTGLVVYLNLNAPTASKLVIMKNRTINFFGEVTDLSIVLAKLKNTISFVIIGKVLFSAVIGFLEI